MLRGKSWGYLMRNTHVILGRAPSVGLPCTWLVDVAISDSKFVARQHALIAYNFEDGRFEIRCLSKRAKIKVDGKLYRM
jgi:hypothetical protein